MIEARSIESAAVLKLFGFEYNGSRMCGERVVIEFSGDETEAQELLAKHESGRLSVSSLGLIDSLRWSRDRVFACRRSAGVR